MVYKSGQNLWFIAKIGSILKEKNNEKNLNNKNKNNNDNDDNKTNCNVGKNAADYEKGDESEIREFEQRPIKEDHKIFVKKSRNGTK